MEKDKIGILPHLLIIGGSAGSLEVILSAVPLILYPLKVAVVVVVHRRFTGDDSLAKLFSYKTMIPVVEIEDKQILKKGTIYIAPVDYHVLFETGGTFALDVSEKVQYSRPSIDVAFESASQVYGENLTCILLSGANADGVEGMRIARQAGAKLFVQDPKTAAFPTMPESAMSRLQIENSIRPEELAGVINNLTA